MFAHVGSFIVSQWRYARRRHSSIHSGSFFLREMRRTMSSFRPFGAMSSSSSVKNPCLSSWEANASWIAALDTIACSPGGEGRRPMKPAASPRTVLYNITALYIRCVATVGDATGPGARPPVDLGIGTRRTSPRDVQPDDLPGEHTVRPAAPVRAVEDQARRDRIRVRVPRRVVERHRGGGPGRVRARVRVAVVPRRPHGAGERPHLS